MFRRHRGLRIWILSILGSGPKNGAEIMDEIEIQSQGWWRPSPGSIYPLLGELEKDGYIQKQGDGRYKLTDKSKSEMEWYPWFGKRGASRIEDMLNEMEGFLSYMEDVSKSDKQKITPYFERIEALSSRLSALVSGAK